MNDEFLHRLREAPSPRFAANLKSRLDALPADTASARRPSALRTMVVALLLGGSAFAVTAISVRGVPPVLLSIFRIEAPPAPAASTTAVAPAEPPREAPRELIPLDSPQSRFAPSSVPAQPASRSTSERAPDARSSQFPVTVIDSAPVSRPGTRAGGAQRDFARIAGPASMVPLVEAIEHQLARNPQYREARFETLDVDASLRKFCAASDATAADMVIVTRRMTAQELRSCWKNGVIRIQETQLGRQVVVLAQNIVHPELKLTTYEIFLALARQVPGNLEPTRLTPNPVTMWQQVGAMPGYQQIKVFGPQLSSASGRAFLELLIESGCRRIDPIGDMLRADPGATEAVCRAIRSDGMYSESGDNPSVIADRVRSSPGSIGVFPYSFFETQRDSLAAAFIEGVAPTAQTIESGTYPGSRTLYVYVNQPSLRTVPGLADLLAGFFEASWPRGLFFDMGIIPPPLPNRSAKILTLQDLQP